MTREERARAELQAVRIEAGTVWADDAVRAMLRFADIEVASMQERAANEADRAAGVLRAYARANTHYGTSADTCQQLAMNIRALPIGEQG